MAVHAKKNEKWFQFQDVWLLVGGTKNCSFIYTVAIVFANGHLYRTAVDVRIVKDNLDRIVSKRLNISIKRWNVIQASVVDDDEASRISKRTS